MLSRCLLCAPHKDGSVQKIHCFLLSSELGAKTRKFPGGQPSSTKYVLGPILVYFLTYHTESAFHFIYTASLTTAQTWPRHSGIVPSFPTPGPPSARPARAAPSSLSSITVGQQQCQDIVREGSHALAQGSVDMEAQKYHAEAICQDLADGDFRISDPMVHPAGTHYYSRNELVGSLSYNYETEWVNGCHQTSPLTPGDIPLPGGNVNCSTLWIGDCTACRFRHFSASPRSHLACEIARRLC